ncbi:hypothetical protein [Bradyrhizobium sp. CCBAU 11361]|uniref:hypothetical protein n=1 Tax=Bradyrhizobium sp. CCBAU 11361 TaxID=1630812 RepID=UPI0023027495|nr:hypothetical protein [Bradyrhizobium sp. CCBAU 11361]
MATFARRSLEISKPSSPSGGMRQPVALACESTFILKPSERDPSAALIGTAARLVGRI